jgi:hypothetical protein
MLVLFPLCLVCVAADNTPAAFQSDLDPMAFQSDEVPSLTAAQQEARDLASILQGKQDATTAPIISTPLVLLTPPSLRPGERLYILLFSWFGWHIYFVSGQQTLTSPVDGAVLVSTSALPFIPTQPYETTPDNGLALGVLVK